LAAYGIVSLSALLDVRALQEDFQYISMEERLPPPKVLPGAKSLPATAAERLDRLEYLIDDPIPVTSSHPSRVKQLEQLHEHAVQVFANRFGFGRGRMPIVGPTSEYLRLTLRQPGFSPHQPGSRVSSVWSVSALEAQLPKKDAALEKEMLQMHGDSILDFVNVGGFGFFKDRRHVAGFQSHHFSQVPGPGDAWQIRTIDLIGLVMHDTPLAYVSEHLPRMEELKGAPTRPLDAFETVGLVELQRGEDLVVREIDGLRLLGAIRSMKQCVACHGGQRGDLLGAFSYSLVRRQK
jgi:hypothetical protein